MALFAPVAHTRNANLVEFRAGKMTLESNNMVHPDKRKGLVYIIQSEDGLMHFCWKDRNTGAVEEDLILFPGDASYAKVSQCTTGRVFLLRIKPQHKLFFWMQEPKSDKDAEYCQKINDLLNHPPTPGVNAGRGAGIEGGALPEDALNSDLLQNALGSMDHNQLHQLLNSMDRSGGNLDPSALLAGLTSARGAGSGATGAATTTAARSAPASAATVSASGSAATNASAARRQVVDLAQFQNILSGISVAEAQQQEQISPFSSKPWGQPGLSPGTPQQTGPAGLASLLDQVAGGSAAKIAGGSADNVTGGSAAKIAGDSAVNVAGDSAVNVAGDSAVNVAGGSAVNVASGSAANIAGVKAEQTLSACEVEGRPLLLHTHLPQKISDLVGIEFEAIGSLVTSEENAVLGAILPKQTQGVYACLVDRDTRRRDLAAHFIGQCYNKLRPPGSKRITRVGIAHSFHTHPDGLPEPSANDLRGIRASNCRSARELIIGVGEYSVIALTDNGYNSLDESEISIHSTESLPLLDISLQEEFGELSTEFAQRGPFSVDDETADPDFEDVPSETADPGHYTYQSFANKSIQMFDGLNIVVDLRDDDDIKCYYLPPRLSMNEQAWPCVTSGYGTDSQEESERLGASYDDIREDVDKTETLWCIKSLRRSDVDVAAFSVLASLQQKESSALDSAEKTTAEEGDPPASNRSSPTTAAGFVVGFREVVRLLGLRRLGAVLIASNVSEHGLLFASQFVARECDLQSIPCVFTLNRALLGRFSVKQTASTDPVSCVGVLGHSDDVEGVVKQLSVAASDEALHDAYAKLFEAKRAELQEHYGEHSDSEAQQLQGIDDEISDTQPPRAEMMAAAILTRKEDVESEGAAAADSELQGETAESKIEEGDEV